MSDILTRLNSIRSRLGQQSSRPERTHAPDPILKARILRQAPQVSGIGLVTRLVISAAFVGSLILMALAVLLLPFPRRSVRSQGRVVEPAAATPAPQEAAAARSDTVLELLGQIRKARTPKEREQLAVSMARDLLAGQKNELGLALLERVTGDHPEWTDAWLMLSNSYRSLGRLEAAYASLQKLVSLDPGHALAHNNLGMIELRRKNPEAAARHLERARALDPTAPEAALNLGVAYEQLFAYSKAAEAYERYLGLTQASGRNAGNLPATSVRSRVERLRLLARAEDKSARALAGQSDETTQGKDRP
jgi:Flp pilus assembly protein TadD